jgi:hypothetical protein
MFQVIIRFERVFYCSALTNRRSVRWEKGKSQNTFNSRAFPKYIERVTEILKNQYKFPLRPRPIHTGQKPPKKSGATIPLN